MEEGGGGTEVLYEWDEEVKRLYGGDVAEREAWEGELRRRKKKERAGRVRLPLRRRIGLDETALADDANGNNVDTASAAPAVDTSSALSVANTSSLETPSWASIGGVSGDGSSNGASVLDAPSTDALSMDPLIAVDDKTGSSSSRASAQSHGGRESRYLQLPISSMHKQSSRLPQTRAASRQVGRTMADVSDALGDTSGDLITFESEPEVHDGDNVVNAVHTATTNNATATNAATAVVAVNAAAEIVNTDINTHNNQDMEATIDIYSASSRHPSTSSSPTTSSNRASPTSNRASPITPATSRYAHFATPTSIVAAPLPPTPTPNGAGAGAGRRRAPPPPPPRRACLAKARPPPATDLTLPPLPITPLPPPLPPLATNVGTDADAGAGAGRTVTSTSPASSSDLLAEYFSKGQAHSPPTRSIKLWLEPPASVMLDKWIQQRTKPVQTTLHSAFTQPVTHSTYTHPITHFAFTHSPSTPALLPSTKSRRGSAAKSIPRELRHGGKRRAGEGLIVSNGGPLTGDGDAAALATAVERISLTAEEDFLESFLSY